MQPDGPPDLRMGNDARRRQAAQLRLDSDVVAWFKANAGPVEGHQTRTNRALRE
jgi:uncharacterized protein (DUF4415 family)